MVIAMRDSRLMLTIILAVALFLTLPALAEIVLAMPDKPRDKKILAIKPQKSISLNDLIQAAGYRINDEDVVLFLTEFIELNPSVKSVSTLKMGTMVSMPVRHLKKTAGSPELGRSKAGPIGLKQRIARKRSPVHHTDPEAPGIYRSMLLRNIQRLFSSLGNDVSLEKEGFRFFSLGEKSDLSFDTGLFPVMDLHNDRILVIDYTAAFPEDMKNLLEVSWPEYRIVSPPPGKIDLRGMVPILLHESGYLFQENSKMVSGGAAQIEYYTDFLVHGKNGKPIDGDISLVSVLDSGEYRTPQEIIMWFEKHDIRIIELSEQDRTTINRMPGSVLDIHRNTQGKAFVENVITLMGYPFSRDENIKLSARKEINYTIRADLLIDMGYKKKILEFSGISDQEMKYISKLGLDIAQIEPSDGKNVMIRKIMSLLSLSYTNSPKTNALSLSPKNSRYRLFLPGFVVKSLKGVFFITDADLDGELLKNIISEGISVVIF